jgi:DNA-binding transcriptional LysR family regulator
MVRKIDWQNQIGRRFSLRDLHVLFTVVQRGSMAKAAVQLGVSQPAVSEVIADLEHMLGVRLLDRTPQGVEPTIYGRALLRRSTVVFDELKQGIKDIEFLTDPNSGELRIGCPESLSASILPPVLQRFSQQYPRVVLHLRDVVSPIREWPELRERKLDVVFERLVRPLTNEDNDLNVEVMFHDELVIAAGAQTHWARRRKIDLAELVNEPWIVAPTNSWGDAVITEAFRARGLDTPKVNLTTFSVHIRTHLLATGPHIAAFPKSVLGLNASWFALKVLPVDLPSPPWPVVAVTLKNRTLHPIAQRFIDEVRNFAQSMMAAGTPDEQAQVGAAAAAATGGRRGNKSR